MQSQIDVSALSEHEKKALKLLAEQEIADKDPLWLIESGYLYIKTKAGELVPFVLNKAQERLHGKVRELWDKNKMIRLFVLKARQLGISTYIEALIYAITSRLPNQNSTIIADDLDGSNYIFEMAKLYQEKLPKHLKVNTKRSNEKKLEFEGTHSQILIDTAENEDAGRKYTFRCAHLSEYAFFKNPAALMLGLSQSVPDQPRTILIKETTANGYNFAKDEWDALERGESDIEIPIFIPWYWGEDYVQPVKEDFVIGDPMLGLLTADEPMLVSKMEREGIDRIPQRLAWRRYAISNKCGKAGINQQIANFKQEYPSTPLEAFKASGECYFDKDSLTALYESAPKYKTGNIIKEANKYVFRESLEGGIFKIYHLPIVGDQYVVGGDACSGSGADSAALVVRSKLSNNICAVYHGKADPDQLEALAVRLGHFYNEADIAVENDKFGFSVNKLLITEYGNVFVKEIVDEKSRKVTKKFGWDTNSVTRPMMLSYMQEEIRESSLALNDISLIKECLTFIDNPKTGKVEAQEGSHDDLVIACAISGAVRRMRPYKKVAQDTKYKYRKRSQGNAGISF